MAEPIRSPWLDWEPEKSTEPLDPTRQNRTEPGSVSSVRWPVGVPRDLLDCPAAQLDAAWNRALAAARAGFAGSSATPDTATLEAAAMLLLDLDETAPEGCRTAFRRQCAETVRTTLAELYSGVARAEILPDGSIVLRSVTHAG